MVKVPAGIFLMGSPAFRGNAEEQPAHEAIVPSLFVDVTEVTVRAYRQCAEKGKCKPARSGHGFCNEKRPDRDEHPVNCIDWYDARDYCAFAGKRVPTEREWEYFAGGGAAHRPYSWGSDEPSQQISCYEHPFGSCKVGSYAPGAFGLHDVSGNVWEWTASAFKPYPSTDRGDEPSAALRFFVYRGGSWSRRFPKWLRTTLRNRYEPDKFHASLGVRCVQTALPLECPTETAAREGVCVRTAGTPQCEPLFAWDGKQCALTGSDGRAVRAETDQFWRGGHAPSDDPAELGVPTAGSSATVVAGAATAASAEPSPTSKPTVTRSRTPQHDPDCALHWPKTPAAYLFQGGRFHDRKPLISAGGCAPRDVGTSYTSACCPG
jgi:hypothetical protein